MEYVDENETIVEPEDEDGGWVSTHNTDSTTNQQSTATQDEKTTEIQLDSDKVINVWLLIFEIPTNKRMRWNVPWVNTVHITK